MLPRLWFTKTIIIVFRRSVRQENQSGWTKTVWYSWAVSDFTTLVWQPRCGRFGCLAKWKAFCNRGPSQEVDIVFSSSCGKNRHAWPGAQEISFESLMNNVPYFIYFKDSGSRFIEVNEAFARKLSPQNKSWGRKKTQRFWFFAPEHADNARADELEVMRSGKPLTKRKRRCG